MRDSDVDFYTFERLRDEFGPFAAGDSDGLGRAERELVGSRYREILGSSPPSSATSGKNIWSVAL